MEEGGKKEKKMQITRKRINGAILLLRQKKGVDLVSFVLNVKCNNSAVIIVRRGETGKRRNNKLSSIVYNYLMFFFPKYENKQQ